MSSDRCWNVARVACFAFMLLVCCTAASAAQRTLRVCADADNLPYSDRGEGGFENEIARLLARDLGAQIEYAWRERQRGYQAAVNEADRCDVRLGVATGAPTLVTTAPYYRASYVFLTRADRQLDISTFDDPRLAALTIGVQLTATDAASSPPVHALAQHGLIDNVDAYPAYVHRGAMPPPIVAAVADGTLDVAIVWGPQAGYFAKRSAVPLHIELAGQESAGRWPMALNIAIGVRADDAALKSDIEDALERERAMIDRVLDAFGVPRAGKVDRVAEN